jgi:hypothetical protein
VIPEWYADKHCNPFYIMLLCMHRVQELNKTLCLSVCYLISCPGHWAHFYFIWCCGYILKVGTQQYCSSTWSTVPLTVHEAEIELYSFCKNGLSHKKIFEWYCKIEIGSSFATLFSNIFQSSEHLVECEDSKCSTNWSVITFPAVELCL